MMWLEQFGGDIRFGARGLARTPGFTSSPSCRSRSASWPRRPSTACSTPSSSTRSRIRTSTDLMSVRVSNPAQRGWRTGYSTDQFLEIAERSTIFDGVIASTISDVLWTGDGDPQRLRGNHGTFNTFDVMGVPPLLGRTPTRGRRAARRGAGRRARLSLLAAAVRRRSERARPAAAAERHQPHGHRRHAEALHVARRRRLPADRVRARPASSKACAACTCSDA